MVQKAENTHALDELLAFVDDVSASKADEVRATAHQKAMTGFKRRIKQAQSLVAEKDPYEAVTQVLFDRLPKFFYFSEYSELRGRINLEKLAATAEEDRTESQDTALSLFDLAGVTVENLMAEDYETRVADLQAAANTVTNEIFEFWTQNDQLTVRFDVDKHTKQHPQGQVAVVRDLLIRIHDQLHQVDTSFDVRSTGFQWFFSFIAAFSAYENYDGDIVVLLDEPGLGLHARAQKDFLRFIDERLGSRRQVIYSTHSPFMVQPTRMERVRIVEDKTDRKNRDAGAIVSSDVFSTDADTLFPLQAALGYDLAQHLSSAPTIS
jgi:predicted ATP-dependent endonuclease of OLD family